MERGSRRRGRERKSRGSRRRKRGDGGAEREGPFPFSVGTTVVGEATARSHHGWRRVKETA